MKRSTARLAIYLFLFEEKENGKIKRCKKFPFIFKFFKQSDPSLDIVTEKNIGDSRETLF